MVKSQSIIFCLLATCLLGVGAGNSGAENPEPGGLFLLQPVGPRAVAMAGAFTAVAGDANTLYWNPSGLARNKNVELMISHTEQLQGFRDEYFAFSLPISHRDALGANAFFSYAEGFERATLDQPDQGSYGVLNSYASIAWAHAWNRQWALGAVLKGIHQSIDGYTAWSVAVDGGILWLEPLPNLDLGMTARNLGMPLKFIQDASNLPMTADLGAAYRIPDWNLLLTLDLRLPWQQEVECKVGAEWMLEEIIRFRAGYAYSPSGAALGYWTGLTGGLGLAIADYVLDYSFSYRADLGNLHSVAVTFPFGKSLQEEEIFVARMEKRLREKQEAILRGYWRNGNDFFYKSDFTNALTFFQKVQAANPNYPGLKEKISQTQKKLNERQASQHVKKAVQAYKRKDYILAIVEWNKVLELAPGHSEAEDGLRQAYSRLSQEEEGSGSPKFSGVQGLVKKGIEALRKAQYETAIEYWNAALAKEPQNSQVRAYLQQTKSKRAEDLAELMVEAEKQWQEEDYPNAVKSWRQALKIDPASAEAQQKLDEKQPQIKALANDLYLKGVEKYVQNRLTEAIVDWKIVLILDPGNPKAEKNLIHAQEKLKEIEAF